MIDLLYRKGAAKIKALENVIAAQRRSIARLEESELKLMVQIREMDQLIWKMGQCTSWDRMRPLFNELQQQTERRKQLESDRIQTLLIPEIKKAYR